MTEPIPPALEAAYFATVVTIDGESPVVVSIGDPPGALDRWLEENGSGSAVVITAWNPFSAPQTAEENAMRNAELRAAIARAGLRWVAAQGSAANDEWFEDSFCVFDVPDALLDQWLVTFRQNAAFRAKVGARLELVWHARLREAPAAGHRFRRGVDA